MSVFEMILWGTAYVVIFVITFKTEVGPTDYEKMNNIEPDTRLFGGSGLLARLVYAAIAPFIILAVVGYVLGY